MPEAQRRRREPDAVESAPEPVTPEDAAPTTSFNTSGPKPAVLGEFKTPRASASDLAFGPPRLQSVAGRDVAFAFEPAAVSFDGDGTRSVTLRNTTAEPQTIDHWQLEGDRTFEIDGLGVQCHRLDAGEARNVDVRFASESELPQAAALIVRSASPHDPARLELAGIRRGSVAAEANCDGGVRISATTPNGRPNSLHSAIQSVQAALAAVMTRQTVGVERIHTLASKDIPPAPPGWQTLLNGVIAQGLLGAIGAISAYVGSGLALAAYDALTTMGLRSEGGAAAKDIAKLTVAVHAAISSSLARGVTTNAVAGVTAAISAQKSDVDSVMREAFFDAHGRTLALSYQNAATTLDNHEGDYAALEAQSPGLGFAALEAYRAHLYCQSETISTLQANHTFGSWAGLLARAQLGTHVAEKWEHAAEGTDLSFPLRSSKNGHHELHDLANGVLELHVTWDADRARRRSIYELHEARIRGLHPDLAKLLTRDSLDAFPLPIVAHGPVHHQTPDSREAYSEELRVARNEGGRVTFLVRDAEGQALLTTLGDGDAFEGSRVLFRGIDDLVLPHDKLKGG